MEEFNSADILKKQNRKKRLAFLEVGLFEISFVFIIIIVLFGILNYFNILSLSAVYPNQLGFLPHKSFDKIAVQKDVISSPLPATSPAEDSVSAVSDVPGYTLTIADQKSLMSYLNATHIWGKTFNDLADPVFLQNIEFHLSSDNQRPENLEKDKSGNPLYSYNLLFINNTLKLYIYLYPNVFSGNNYANVFSNAVMTVTSQLSLSGKGGKNLSQEEINKITTQFVNEKFFLLQKGP